MGKVIAKQIRGMSWNAKVSLVLICTLVMSVFMYEGWYKPRQSQAASVAVQQAWSSIFSNTAYPSSTLAYTVTAGTNRMLVVGVSSTLTGNSSTQTCTVTYGGQAMTQATANNGTSAQQHTYLFYLKEAGIAAAGANTGINVTLTNGTAAYTHVVAAVFNGVDQSNIAGFGNYISTSQSSTIGPLDTALTLVSGDQAIDIVNLTRTGSSSARTVSSWGSGGWAQAFTSSGNNGSNYAVSTTIGTTTTAGTTTPQHTASSSALRAMSAMVLKAIQGPIVTSLSPNFGNPGQSFNVTITGSNFASGATASFGAGVTVTGTTFNSATQLTASISIDAAAATGNRDVTVTNPDTKTGTLSAGFTVASANAPTISTITPAVLGQGATNATLAATGSNFDATSAVTVSGTGVTAVASYVDASHLNITFTVSGSATAGTRDLTVTNSDGSHTTTLGAVTINARPTITTASPAFATPGSTLDVTITGTGFVNGATLNFGSGVTVNGTVTFTSATSLKANVTLDPGATAGSRNVTVTNPDYGTNSAAIFNVSGPPPTISSITPNVIGQGATSKLYTIVGTNFISPATVAISGSNVTVGTVTVVDPQTITVLLTASTSASTGARNVTVTLPDTQTVTATGILAVNSRPSVTSSSPAKATTGSTTDVIITGTGFQNGAVASFSNAGITVNSTTYNSATQLTANITVSPSAAGTATITVTNPDGGNRSGSSNAFVLTPVGVFSASPGIPQGATGNVAITGQGFATGTTLVVSGTGVMVNSVQVVNANNLTANISVVSGAATGVRDITATVGANSGTGAGVFTVTIGPSITALSPASLRQGMVNQDVTITGSNFQPGCTVQFNGTGVTLNSLTPVSDTQLTANVSIDQNAPLAAQSVTVTNPDGGNATGGPLAILLTGKTLTGGISFTKVTGTSISMVISYSGDGDNDNSCTVAYGRTPALELGSIPATKANGAYSAVFNNLQNSSEGVGQLYYFQVTFADGDGIVGSSQLAASQPTKGSQLLHNSQNTFSFKWNQGWGIDGGKYGAFTCATCHNENTANSKLVADSIQAPSLENWSSSKGSTLNVVYKNTLGDDSAHATSTNVCEVCHSRTNHHKYNNPAANHEGASDCMTCHSHDEGFLPSCKTCHATAQGANGYRRQIVGNGGDFFTNMSTHGNFTNANSQTCTACHDATAHQAYSDGVSVALMNADTGARVVYDGTAATAVATSTVCISCHDADGATRMGTIAKAPFAASDDFQAPTDINQYWPAANGAHTTKMVCFNCHGSSKGVDGSTTNPRYNGHASGTKHMLQDTAYDVVNPNNYCFNCHNAASTDPNKSSKDIAGELAKAYKHSTAKCFDCHGDESNSIDSLHSIRAGSQVVGSGVIANNISNATGRSMTWSLNTWAGATASTSLAANAATAEYQVCFKCHAAVGTGTTPDVPGSGTAAASLTNLALEFNPNNMSGHPIVTGLNNYPNSFSPKALTAAKMKAPWNVNLGTQTMSCSDCHATDTAASKGPHGSSVKWMLTGTNKAWPYTTTAGNGASTGTLFTVSTYSTGNGTNNGLFCLNCHVVTGSNNFHAMSGIASGQHANNASIPACVSCHIRVPHGGDISRLLQTTNAPARYRATGIGGTPNFTAWGPVGGTIKGAAGSSSNFRSSCSEHSGTGGEAW